MNTIQNNKDLTKHVKYFQEVYPINLLPATLIKPSITVNHKHYMPDSHWVAVCIYDSGYAKYFDSYGLPPYKLEIMAFLQRHSISKTFNRHRLHDLTSKVCGHYCCIYALWRVRRQSMTSFVNTFVPAPTPATIKKAVPMFCDQFGEWPLLQPVGEGAAVVQGADIKVSSLTIISLQCLSLSDWLHILWWAT